MGVIFLNIIAIYSGGYLKRVSLHKNITMRENKFKAWNEELKKYSKPFTLKSTVLNFTDDNGLGTIKSLTYEIIVQFTGLKDKNGVEIYEGDIIEGTAFNGKKLKCKVIYDENYGCYQLESFKEKPLKFPIKAFLKELEVIGNIHENPELLK